MFKVKDLMARELVVVKKDTPITDAMKLLIEHKITGIPVVSDDNKLLGVISEKDMLALVMDASLGNMPVSEFMTSKVTTFDEDDDLQKACECLIKSSFRRLPILSKGKLVGILSRRDVIKFILKLRE